MVAKYQKIGFGAVLRLNLFFAKWQDVPPNMFLTHSGLIAECTLKTFKRHQE